MFHGCTLVRGKPRHSQSQGSVERANQDVEKFLACWMKENNTAQWAMGLPFVQLQKNTTYQRGIHQTPYEALFGKKCLIGIQNRRIPKELWDKISTEEELEEALADASVKKKKG